MNYYIYNYIYNYLYHSSAPPAYSTVANYGAAPNLPPPLTTGKLSPTTP